MQAATAALDEVDGLPAVGRESGAARSRGRWIGRRFGVAVEAAHVGACVGTKELVAGLPHLLRLRNPQRDTVLYPAIAYPSYEMGAVLAGCRAVPVPLDADWHLDLDAVSDADAERALVLWVNEPGNPTSSAAGPAHLARRRRVGPRPAGIVVASDECYTEYAPEPATILASGLHGVLAMHSLSKRSNLAGMRVGFYAGDPELVEYLVETRKHAGLMAPVAMQAAAVAALGDDEHVAVQRGRYEERRALAIAALAPLGLVHDGGPCLFYLWLRQDDGADDGWEIAAQLAHAAGLLVAPGDLYGPRGADHVRLALVQPTIAFELAFDRLAGRVELTTRRTVADLEKTITQLWEAGDAWRDVMPVSQAHDAVRSVIGMLDRGEVRVAEIGEEIIVNEWAKLAILMWFRLQEMQIIEAGPFEYVDKIPLKKGYKAAGVRVVPGASARFGAYLAPTVVMMPSYVNIGAYVDEGTMVDTWATVGSCAQIGKNVHLAGGVGIGGVLEPAEAVAGRGGRRLLHRLPLHDRERRARAEGFEARRRSDLHVEHARDRCGDRQGAPARRHSGAFGGGAGHAHAGVRGRHVRPAVRADPADARRG